MPTTRYAASAAAADPTTEITHILEEILTQKPGSNLHRLIFMNDGLAETFLEILQANSVDILKSLKVPPPADAAANAGASELAIFDYFKLDVLQQFYLHQAKINGTILVWTDFDRADLQDFRANEFVPISQRVSQPQEQVHHLSPLPEPKHPQLTSLGRVFAGTPVYSPLSRMRGVGTTISVVSCPRLELRTSLKSLKPKIPPQILRNSNCSNSRRLTFLESLRRPC